MIAILAIAQEPGCWPLRSHAPAMAARLCRMTQEHQHTTLFSEIPPAWQTGIPWRSTEAGDGGFVVRRLQLISVEAD